MIEFISLEDISHRYKKPCIMDLKMGITQHLEEMSAEKKALAVAKCKNSTSFTMGFRICGIKVSNTPIQACGDAAQFTINPQSENQL